MTVETLDISVHPFPTGFGAELRGLDLSQPLDQRRFDAWKASFEKHRVLVLRGQHFSDAQHVAFSRWFGELEVFPEVENQAKDFPVILRVSNVDRDTDRIKDVDEPLHKAFVVGTSKWHIDSSYRKVPSEASFLYSREVPASGGDTLFANMEMAYAGLPAQMKARIDGLVAVHEFGAQARRAGAPHSAEALALYPPVRHPVAQRLSNGNRALFLGTHLDTIEGMDDAEAQQLIAELTEWATRPEFSYRHQWKVGDLVMWDNHVTMHRAMPYELANERRVLQRTTIAGRRAIV